ncbi:MAG: hypothetical protein ACFBWO_14270 [Paracoccaceae bacterium]
MSRVTEQMAGGFWLRDGGRRKAPEATHPGWRHRLLAPLAFAALVVLGCLALVLVSGAAASGVDLDDRARGPER